MITNKNTDKTVFWYWVSICVLCAIIGLICGAFIGVSISGGVDREAWAVILNRIRVGGAIITTLFTGGTLVAMIIANRMRAKEAKIANKREFIKSLCLGLLQPNIHALNDVSASRMNFSDIMRSRFENNGFYDGARAFLGEMMSLPTFPEERFENSLTNGKAHCFFDYGPHRFGITWDFLFNEFHKYCEMVEIESGLERYFHGELKHQFHTENIHDNFIAGMKAIADERDDINLNFDNIPFRYLHGIATSGNSFSVPTIKMFSPPDDSDPSS